MSTFTQRLNLEKPETGDSMALGDNVFSSNYEKIDSAVGTTVDAVQPPAPFEGQLWSQGDTDLTTEYFYDSKWNLLGADPIQRGFTAYEVDGTVRQSDDTFITLMSIIFDAKAGRDYWVEWNVFYKWRQPGEGLVGFHFFHLQDSIFIREQILDLYSGIGVDLGQTITAGFKYSETTDRLVQLIMFADPTLGGGLTLEVNTGNNQSNVLVTDIGAT